MGVIQLLSSHKVTKICIPLPLVLILVIPLLQTFKTSHHPLPLHHHHYTIAKSCYFIDPQTSAIISTYKCHKKYSPDMNVTNVLIDTNDAYTIKASIE